MNPVGDYNTFREEFLSQYEDFGDHEIISFGILLADFRQSDAREYILNYLEDFHLESGRIFDFFIPGYIERWAVSLCDLNKRFPKNDCIQVGRTDYIFSYALFQDFYENLSRQFGIKYTFNPILILMSMEKCHPGTAHHIVIELDNIPGGIRRSGELFSRIFQVARADNSLEAFRKKCFFTFVKDNIVNTIANARGIPWLEQIERIGEEYRRYRIRR